MFRKLKRLVFMVIDPEPNQAEIDHICSMGEEEFQSRRLRHENRRIWPEKCDGVGILFLLSLFGVSYCFLRFLFVGEIEWLFSALFWFVPGIATRFYLRAHTSYWREHRLIRLGEHQRSLKKRGH